MNKTIKLFKLFGITIRIHLAFFLLPAFIGLSLLFKEGPMAALRGIILIAFIFTCVTLHELTHSLVAQKFNIKVKDITLLPIGGIASMKSMPKKPREEFLMSIAGPLFNLALAALLFYPIYLIIGQGIKGMSILNIGFNSWSAMLLYMFWINPLLAIFNLLPAFPMDGGRALRAFLAERMSFARATRIAVSLGHFFAIIFGLLGLLSHSIILILIAFFVYVAASQEEEQVNLKLALKSFKVNDVLNSEFLSLKPEVPLSQVLELSLKTFQQDFAVVKDGKLLGILTRQNLLSAIHQYGKNKRIDEVMSKKIISGKLDENLNSVYNKMVNNRTKVIAILKGDHLQGIVTLEDIARVYSMQTKNK